MSKAPSPVRLQQELIEAAALNGRRSNRSVAEQIEYWAELGRQLADSIDLDILIMLKSGLFRLRIEPVAGPGTGDELDMDKINENIERMRERGELSKLVTSAALRYRSSQSFPGCLEQVDLDGNVIVGTFKDGQFSPLTD